MKNPNYKSILKNNNFTTIEQVIEFYAFSKRLFMIQSKTKKAYSLIFNKQYNSPILVPRITKEDIEKSPRFYLDDDNIIIDLYQMVLLALVDRFDFLLNNNGPNFKISHSRYVSYDMAALTKLSVNQVSFTENNRIKVENRIRVIKTYSVSRKKKGEKIYCDCIGDVLGDMSVPDSDSDIKKYAAMFNDPINVASLQEGLYCSIDRESYSGVGYGSDNDTITSIFSPKSNLPERLRQHYTSNFLEPYFPEPDFLQAEDRPLEKNNALCVFMPVDSEYDKIDSPLEKNSLLAGEILISKELSRRGYILRRTYTTDLLDVDIVPIGTVLSTGDPIAYDREGSVNIRYDAKYSDAIVDEIIESPIGYKVVLKIKAELSVARIISDYGIKGVTHPREDLGTIVTSDGEENPVEMIIGPNAMKSGSNGIRLSWLAMKTMMNHDHEQYINIDPDVISEEEVTDLTSDIQKMKWTYNGKTIDVYAGIVSFGVTDLAKDCRTDKVKIMPETLKFLYLSQNEHLERVADLLSRDFIKENDKWILREILALRSVKTEGIVKWKYDDKIFKEFLQRTYFDTANWMSASTGASRGLLLNPLNEGMIVEFEDYLVRLPSAKVINHLTSIVSNSITYPKFMATAMYFLLSLKLYSAGKTTKDKVLDNIVKYYASLDEWVFNKKALLSSAICPMVEGGNLKQLVSPHVPIGVTVVLDKYLGKKISKFRKSIGNRKVYEIGVRNPVLWKFQFSPKEVWTLEDFKEHINEKGYDIDSILLEDAMVGSVLRNTYDTLYDQADTDGDLFPVAIPMHREIQFTLHKYVKNPIKIQSYEREWTLDYIKNEANNESFLNIEEKPFKYYTVSRKWFSTALANSAIAKGSVGLSTVDKWNFDAIAEHAYLKGEISSESMDYMQFLFARVCQDYTIRGIKHSENGASNYFIYSLSSFKSDLVSSDLQSHMGVSALDAELFVSLAKSVKENRHAKILSRLPSGGRSNVLSDYTISLPDIEETIKNNMSYAKLLHPYWNDLVPQYSYSN